MRSLHKKVSRYRTLLEVKLFYFLLTLIDFPENFVKVPDERREFLVTLIEAACGEVLRENVGTCLVYQGLHVHGLLVLHAVLDVDRELLQVFHRDVAEAVEAHRELAGESVRRQHVTSGFLHVRPIAKGQC